MIYLIGGPPKCGKTTLAKRLADKYRISWISADTLENIVWAYTSEEKRPSLFPHSSSRGDSNDQFYSDHSAEEIVRNYIIQGETTYDAISMMAETYLTDKDDYIVEGFQVAPEIVDRIFKKFGQDHVRAVFLVRQDEQKFIQDIHKSTTPNDWVIQKTKDEATYGKISAMIAEYSRYFEMEAEKYGLRVFSMDEYFDQQLDAIENHLKSSRS